jgi:hypothetical protein
MIYTKQMFGQELKKLALIKKDLSYIGCWSYLVYSNWPNADDTNFLNLLLFLNKMELGPEFAISYDMLNKIADDLIAGKEVDLNSDEYSEINE